MELCTLVAVVVMILMVTTSHGQPSKGCCMPQQFSANLTDLSTINAESFSLTSLQYDFTQQKEVSVNMINDTNTGKVNITGRTVIDFVNHTMYYLPANEPTQCYKSPYYVYLNATQCLPATATYLGSTYLGPLGGPLPYDGWRFQLPNSNIFVTIAVTREGCVPLVEGLTMRDRPQNDKVLLFTAFQPKLVDPDLFNIPSFCLK